MGTFVVKSSTLNSQYEYKDANLFVNGNYSKDATTDTLQNVSGSCYRINAQGEQGEYVGNFKMTRKDSNDVWDAIDAIELNIIGTNED